MIKKLKTILSYLSLGPTDWKPGKKVMWYKVVDLYVGYDEKGNWTGWRIDYDDTPVKDLP